jgi:sigma-B regulation protein RsbU (phosphoserine phosphatase)
MLKKLGYNVERVSAAESVTDIIGGRVVDIIVLDGRETLNLGDYCEFFRVQEATRALPIVVLAASEAESVDLQEKNLPDVEVMPGPFSIGKLAGRVATKLRLRKFAGQDDLKASVAEINATLRDLNARLKKDLDDARSIQQSLLPESLPGSDTYQVAASYQPLEEVGGDWYCANRFSDGSIILSVADVTGHGLSAAFIGSMAKLALTAAGEREPNEVLREMNRLMAPQIPSGRFVTMCCGRYYPDTGVLQFARAGHPPAVLVRASDGSVEMLAGDGFALGFFEDSEYEAVNAQLNPGDLLLLYSDGISEAQNRSQVLFGTERLAEALAKHHTGESLGEILSGILDDFDDFREERILKDDVTLLVLRRTK